jgi:protein-L-isoaspartate(D-aspartate) O-methyltransferase
MAWRSSGTTNESLIANLERNKLIESDRVKQAMLEVSTMQHQHTMGL